MRLDDIDGYNASVVTRAWTKADYQFADKISDMLVAFAKNGEAKH